MAQSSRAVVGRRLGRFAFERGVRWEALESRMLLSSTPTGPIDLMPTAATGIKLASSIVTGKSIKGSVKVSVANDGTGASAKSAATVVAYLRPSGGGADVPIVSKAAAVPAIAGDKSKTISVNLVVPASLAAGSYTLVLTIVDGAHTTETDSSNNSLVVPYTLSAAAAFVDLDGTLNTSKLPTTVEAGDDKKLPIAVSIANGGNVAAGGSVTVTIALRPSAGADVTVLSKVVKLPSIKSDKSGSLPTISISLPSGVPAGSYTLVVTVTPSDTSVAPVTVQSGTITVTSASQGGGGSDDVLPHGERVAFSADTNLSSPFLETGHFVTNKNYIGTYRLTGTSLTFSYGTGETDVYGVIFIGSPVFLDSAADEGGKAIEFSTNATGALFELLDPVTSAIVGYGVRDS